MIHSLKETVECVESIETVELLIIDPQFERNSSGKLVPLASSVKCVGVDFTLDIDVSVE